MKNLKKVLAVVLMLAVVFTFAACGSDNGGSDNGGALTVQAVKDKGVLVIGGEMNYPPYEYYDDDENIIGYDHDIWQIICDDLGVEMEIVDVPFAGVLTGLDAGQYDVAGCAIGVTQERSASYLFCAPIMGTGFTVTTLASTTDIKSAYDLAGKTIGCQTGSTPEIFAGIFNEELKAAGKEEMTIKTYSGPSDCFLDMKNGGVDACIESFEISGEFINEDKDIVYVDQLPDMINVSFAFDKQDTELCDYVSAKILEMKADGTLAKLQQKWFGYTVDNLSDTPDAAI